MRQYLDLLRKILAEGREKESARDNMPNTIGISNGIIKMGLQEGFPLLTTKKMYWKGIVHELLWFLHGDTNIKYLVDNNVNIWNKDAYRWYQKWWDEMNTHLEGLRKLETIDEFIEQVKQSSNPIYPWKGRNGGYMMGDLGKVYGYQWRSRDSVDQVTNLIDGLKNKPYGRYHILDAWNPADLNNMALPPCHLLYQFIVRPLNDHDRVDYLNKYFLMYDQTPWILEMIQKSPKIDEQYGIPKFYLDLNMYQRSCDTAIGVPTNIASMSLFLMIIAKVCNMEAGIATWIGGDTHIYVEHIEGIREQLERSPYRLPELLIKKEINSLDNILTLTINDFELIGYQSHPAIKYELFVGLKT
jgi:thymidylate synthase